MNLLRRYRQLSIWNRLAVWGSLASILSIVVWLGGLIPILIQNWRTSQALSIAAVTGDFASDRPAASASATVPREILFLVDTSMSMRGTPIAEAITTHLRDAADTPVGLAKFGDRELSTETASRGLPLALQPGRYPAGEYLERLQPFARGPCSYVCGALEQAARSFSKPDGISRKIVLFTDNNFGPCRQSPRPPEDCEYEKRWAGVSLEIVLLGVANEAETTRLFPAAKIDARWINIGGTPPMPTRSQP